MPSPSKDSRGLIDAHDQPLHVTTPDGKQHEWPTLTTQSGRSPSAYSMDDPEDLKEPGPDLRADARAEANAAAEANATAEAAVTSSSLVAAAANLTNVINTKNSSELTTRERRSYSESSSYATANESPALAQSNKRLSVSARRTHQNVGMSPQHARGRSAQSFSDVPSRTASLRSRLSSGSLVMVTPDRRSKKQFLGFTDFTQPRSDTPASNESRLFPTNFVSLMGGVRRMFEALLTIYSSVLAVPAKTRQRIVDVVWDQIYQDCLTHSHLGLEEGYHG